MEPKCLIPKKIPCMLLLFLMFLCTFCSADLNKDREKCANQLVSLAGCLQYVSGEAKAPTVDCCTGLKLVLEKSRECLCILIKDRDDPNLGLKINATLALGLPDKCHTPANISECPALLHLAPNSPDAKIFEDFGKNGKGSNTTAPADSGSSTTGQGTTAAVKNDGGKTIKWLRIEMVLGLLITVVLHVLPILGV